MNKLLLILCSMASGSFLAQEYEQMREQLNNIQHKMDKLNVFLNFQSEFSIQNKGEETKGNFEGKMARVELRGNINPKIFYRLRIRLNKSFQTTSDNLSDAADIMSVGYNINDKLSVSFGKMGQNWGGFEYELTPMNIFDYSDFVNNIEAFLVGGFIYYKHSKNNEFSLNVANISTKSFIDLYQSKDATLEKSPFSYGYILTWDGKIKGEKIRTRWSIGYQQQAKGKSSKMLILGNKFNFQKWNFFVDYNFAQENLDKLGYAEIYTENGAEKPKLLKNIFYHSIISRLEYKPNPHWRYSIQGGYELARPKKIESEKNYDARKQGFNYFLGVEYLPFIKQNLSIYATYVGRSFRYHFSEMDYNTHRFNFGIMYRAKLF